jgi:DNA-binding NarL/FixJ family response regulator
METVRRIALVDDHRLFRSGIASLINNFCGYEIIFEAANGAELMQKISPESMPDIVLLDMSMPVMDGKSTAKWLLKTHPGVKIVVLSMYNDAERVMGMIKLGVKGYLLKDSEPQQFEEALQKVSEGDLYYPDFVTRLLINSFNQQADLDNLNRKEVDFLKLVCTELTYREIAEKLNVSVRTVDGYRDQLFEKLHIKSRVGLVLYAFKNKLVDL